MAGTDRTDFFNPALREFVRQLYDEIVAQFGASQDLHSEDFLPSFPYRFFPDDG